MAKGGDAWCDGCITPGWVNYRLGIAGASMGKGTATHGETVEYLVCGEDSYP